MIPDALAHDTKIREIIDKHLNKWIERKLNTLPGKIEAEMADPVQTKNDEWKTWHPVNSKVTDAEIEDHEQYIRHKFPDDYKSFLKYKHFYELHISEASFCEHPVNIWRAAQTDMIFDGYPAEFLIEKGFIPFADWSDWGLLCFDTNRNNGHNNYPIVLWDHEMANRTEDVYKDFYDMMIRLDEEEDKMNATPG